MSYLQEHGARRGVVTPINEPIPGAGQVMNSAGGFVWQVGPFERLRRFLILGSEQGSYYADQRELTTENVDGLRECLALDGRLTVATIEEVSVRGRAAKQQPGIFALAVAAACGLERDAQSRYVSRGGKLCDAAGVPCERVRELALQALPRVCRTGTTLFQFVAFMEGQRGWGRAARWGVGAWYTRAEYESEGVSDLAYQLVKYRQRDGWTHRDVLRLAHPVPVGRDEQALLAWAAGKYDEDRHGELPPVVVGFEELQRCETSAQVVDVLGRYPLLPREAVRSELMTAEVWRVLLGNGMPITALIRNLATMTRLGVLATGSSELAAVTDQITDQVRLVRGRVHPIAVLIAMHTYRSGHSLRGNASWTPLSALVDALDDAFYKTFVNVQPTGKRTLLALDVSNSMSQHMISNVPGLSAREASAAMVMVQAASGDPCEVVAFSDGTRGGGWYGRGVTPDSMLTPLDVSPRRRLDDNVRAVSGLSFGRTDCALPMVWANAHEREFDAFVIYTDNETWFGAHGHPSQALQSYQRASGLAAKLVVVGMVANRFTIADPNDAGMMDVVGFDTAAPGVIQDFIAE